MYKDLVTWRKKLKIRAIRLFDSKCYICGYNTCIEALEFHHLNKEEKEFSISRATKCPRGWQTIVSELRKCVLLCANCHREAHYGNLNIENKSYLIEEYVNYEIFEGTKHLCSCGKMIALSKKTCGVSCGNKSRQLIDWDKEKPYLIRLREEDKLTYAQIAKIYSTSDKTISKWYNKFKDL